MMGAQGKAFPLTARRKLDPRPARLDLRPLGHQRLADLELAHEGAVGAVEVAEQEAGGGGLELELSARDGRVGEQQIAIGAGAHHHDPSA
jgi:hypothetical protein